MSLATPPETDLTVEEIAARVGAIPYPRIRAEDPLPGHATEADIERIRCQENRLYELIDGVLVEKAVSEESTILAAELIIILGNFVKPRRLGWVVAPDGYYRLFGSRLRAPDVSFVRRDQRPQGRPLREGYSNDAPALAVEVFSPGNTAREMDQERDDFFAAGTELIWIVYPAGQKIEVSTDSETHDTLGHDDTLEGGTVLPGFTVQVADIFDALNLGPDSV